MGYTGFPEYNDTMFFIVANGDVQWTHAPITRGTWHDFVLHVMWSADPDYGFVELWYDGEIIVPLTNVATLFSAADTNYLKQGLYRDELTEPTAFLYHDGMVVGTTLDDVTRPPVTPDADEDAEAIDEIFPDLVESDPMEVADAEHEGEAAEAVDLGQDGDGLPGCSEAQCEQACESSGLGSGQCAGDLCVCVTGSGDEGCGCTLAG
jgi:hypothetical protein